MTDPSAVRSNNTGRETAPRFFAARVSLAYGSYFAFLGLYLPYFPLWLQSRGVNDFQIGVILAVPMAVRVLSSGLVISAADTRYDRAAFTMTLYWFSAVAFWAYAGIGGFFSLLILTIVMNVFWNPVLPLLDAIALAGVKRYGENYGRIRVWGSGVFIVANLGGGMVLIELQRELILHVMIAVMFIGAFLAFALPRGKAGRSTSRTVGREFSFSSLMRMPGFATMLLAAGLLQASHALIYGFGTIYWQATGYSGLEIGLFWAVGVLAEMVLFQFSTTLVDKFGIKALFIVGGVGAFLRWLFFP